jgi:FAD/FMN-containing dehydrogenase
MRTTVIDQSVVDALQSVVSGKLITEGELVAEVSGDFGRIIHRTPKVVVRPSSTVEVQATIRFARERGIAVSTRAAGHSLTGQTSNDGGILIDMRSLNQIVRIDAEALTATAQGGALWRDLVAETLKQKLIPRVLTNNLGITIGGTLSIAGVGIASYKYGAQVDNVTEMEVVTGAGDIVVCSEDKNKELFDAVRSGLGQCGVITRATLRLRKCKANVRSFVLLYDDLEVFMRDSETVFAEHRLDYLESFSVPAPMGFKGSGASRAPFAFWLFPMLASIEFDDESDAPSGTELKAGLHYYKDLGAQDLSMHEFSNRLEDLFTIWRNTGLWDMPHPWMETILPWEVAGKFISTSLAQMPPHAMGGGHILLWPCTNTVFTHTPLFKRPPDSPFTMGWGLIPCIPPKMLDLALPRLDMASKMSSMVGGKRYLSGYVTFSKPEDWERHYGAETWAWFKAMKAKYDPDRLLNRWFVNWGE